ncbi:MAG TPA: GNAT family N-acetyltransferase [Pirellulales bacterium]|nr:GNAT family N-acetyltransferase [Pirellulales bacterium]
MKLSQSSQLEHVQIGMAAPDARAATLELAFGALPKAEREGLVRQALARTGEQAASEGLFEARRGGRLAGALCSELQPGRTAGLWPPRIAAGEPAEEACAAALIGAALDWLLARNVRIVQSLLPTDAGRDADRLRAAGFTHPADLLYLVSDARSFPTARGNSGLSFQPAAERGDAELAKLVEATYEQTLDCPSLNGVQDCGDVLAGYRATSSFDPSRWFVARHSGQDVGCLLLADIADANQWLLVYMGLLPAARGRGLGIELVRHAQWLCGQAGRARMVLAVDAENAPAVEIYAAAGFVAWDRRSVWLRVLEG